MFTDFARVTISGVGILTHFPFAARHAPPPSYTKGRDHAPFDGIIPLLGIDSPVSDRRSHGTLPRIMVATWVAVLTRLLPMRTMFFHHVLFTVLTVRFPFAEYDICDHIPLWIGWGIIFVCGTLCWVSAMWLEKSGGIRAGVSLILYCIFGYITTPTYFACYKYLYDKDVHRWLVLGMIILLVLIKIYALYERKVQRNLTALQKEKFSLLATDLNTIDTDMPTQLL
eukprot:TRINITY_DN6015_c1_g1_i1.p1 TRINITY_DN6015_c1_g1~~TRINITY_DN6015_c1_g1_i1.p1  ORF type:complete len:226 (-),score=14.22 TRINITY_DN6015_c1_g1_i1:33-710(-)